VKKRINKVHRKVENFMNVKYKSNAHGFTIIEVVLVLAIAGLIFMMVFIALPALQRGQRDTARKNDVSDISSAVTSFTSNNRGTFPTSAQLDSYAKDVSDNTTSVVVGASGPKTISPADGVVTVTQKTTCGTSSPTGQILAAGTTRQFTVVTKLESGGGAYFCLGT
jgi:prepilin-type N-terminal cleavage/methylation domain-containing protein